MRGLIDSLRSSATSALYPSCCSACELLLPEHSQGHYCDPCRAELSLISGPSCDRCGAPVAGYSTAKRCPHCDKHAMRFDRAIAAGVYDGLMRQQVLAAKHATGEAAAVGLACLMADAAARQLDEKLDGHKVDVVVSIPMHWRRRIVRQHNPTETMGAVVAKRLSAPFESRLLAWRRATRKQAELAITPRSQNVRGAMRARSGYRFPSATIVVVDDILTTGATCSDAARALKEAGAARVVAVVAARSL